MYVHMIVCLFHPNVILLILFMVKDIINYAHRNGIAFDHLKFGPFCMSEQEHVVGTFDIIPIFFYWLQHTYRCHCSHALGYVVINNF